MQSFFNMHVISHDMTLARFDRGAFPDKIIHVKGIKMSKKMILTFFILLIIVPLIISASDPSFYIKKENWSKSMWASINALEKMEPLGKATGMPDFGCSNYTFMVWLRTEAERATIYGKLSRQSQRPEYQGKILYIDDGILKFQIESIGTFSSDYAINDGKWHHVVLAGKDPCEFYIDGEKVKETYLDNNSKLIPDRPDLRVLIGYSQWRFPFRQPVSFDGIMDEMKIYNRKLSSDEIKHIYQDISAVENGLAGWWRFEKVIEDEGDKIIIDSSPYENNGQLYNCEIVEGKIGKGLRLSSESGVRMRRSAGLTARNLLWNLVARDFSSQSDISQMEIEQNDGIWNQKYSENGIEIIANQYAEKTRDFSNLKSQAGQLVSSASDFDDVSRIRELYHNSVIGQNLYTGLQKKIISTESAVRHLIGQYGNDYKNGEEYLSVLRSFKNQAEELIDRPTDSDFAKKLGENFDTFQYQALVANNPLFDFDELIFVKRYTYQSSHYYTDFIDGTENPGGQLSVLSLKDGSVRDLLPEMSGGIFGRYDPSFDAKTIVFDWKEKIGKGFRLFEVGVDGKDFRQLTFEPEDEEERIAKYDNSFLGGTSRIYQHHTDDMHPCYLPDGRIVFSSTRCEFSVLCDGPTKLTTAVLYRIDSDGKNMVKLTNSAVSEFSPTIMHDGRILYNRWEYVDKGQIAVKCLWAMHPDGSSSQEIYGNDIPYPPVFIHGRPIPGSNNQFVFLGTPHYPQTGVGTVIRIDINKPIRTHEPMTYITPHVDIRTEGGFHHKIDGEWVRTDDGPLYMDPYPLSQKFFLVSHNPDKKWNDIRAYGLYLIDEFGNHVKIYQDSEYSSWQPMPLKARKRPPIIPSVRFHVAAEPEEATVIMSDVYEGLEGIERGTVKYIRVLEQVPRPWSSRRMWEYDGGAPAISRGSVLGLKVLHGVVPVHEDGSAYFKVPANKNIYFEALDENYMELQRQRTYINYMPGEKRTCIGCHELRQFSPGNKPIKALEMEPVRPQPQPGEIAPRSMHYVADVQPVLDKYCISCHNETDNAGDLVLTGELTYAFNVSYENIVNKGLVVTVDEGDDFEKTEPLPPKSIGSHASKFITTIMNGHQGIKLPIEDFVKLTTWVDANAQYYGSYYGRQAITYKDHPDFRPLHTYEEAVGALPPYKEKHPNWREK